MFEKEGDSTYGFISPDVPVISDQFEWTVGKKRDGSYLSPGTYGISLENIDCDRGVGTVKLAFPKLRIPRFIERIPLHKVPGCPMCFQIDPRELKFDPVDVEPVRIVIARGRHIFAKLGNFGRGLALPGPVRIRLDQQNHDFIMNRQPGFELRVISADGRILHQQAIQLEIMK
jgi:hypothetical protein